MSLTGAGSGQFPSVPGGAGYSVSKGMNWSANYAGQADLTHLSIVFGIASTTPTTWADLTAPVTINGPQTNGRLSAQFDSMSSTYKGTVSGFLASGQTGFTTGLHLWICGFDQAIPGTGDPVNFASDLGLIVA